MSSKKRDNRERIKKEDIMFFMREYKDDFCNNATYSDIKKNKYGKLKYGKR